LRPFYPHDTSSHLPGKATKDALYGGFRILAGMGFGLSRWLAMEGMQRAELSLSA
jgi:hypothetical protein